MTRPSDLTPRPPLPKRNSTLRERGSQADIESTAPPLLTAKCAVRRGGRGVRFMLGLAALFLAACTSAPPTLRVPPTETPIAASNGEATPLPPVDTATPLPITATPAPSPTPPPNAVMCPFTGLPVAPERLQTLRPILAQIGNSNPERPQFGLMQADLVFETLSEGGITRFSAIYLCQDADDIAGIRSGRLINLQLVPMFDAIFVHVGASRAVQALFEKDERIRASSLDQFRNHPGFTRDPVRRRPPFDVFASTTSLYEAARQRNILMPGNPPPQLNFGEAAPAGGQAIASITIRHHNSYWVRWKWNDSDKVWERYLSNSVSGDVDTPHADAATGRVLTARNVVILRAPHVQTDIIEDSLGSRSQDVTLIGSGEAVFLRDGQLFSGAWKRDHNTDWFTLTLPDGSTYPLTPGNSYIHFYPPDKPLDVVTR